MIRTVEDINTAKAAFELLFCSTDPFAPAGKKTKPVRTVLFPTDSYHLRRDQFDALMGASKRLHENRFYISEMEADNPFDQNARWKREHWICTNPTYDEYASLMIAVDSAVYSETGTWGILISHELHGLFVCDEQFWQAFKRHYTNIRVDFDEFLEYWRRIAKESGTDAKWLSSFIDHLTK